VNTRICSVKELDYKKVQEILVSVSISNVEDEKFNNLLLILNTLPHIHRTIPLSAYFKKHFNNLLFKSFRKNISTETFKSFKILAKIISETYWSYSKGAIQFQKDLVNKNKLIFIIKNHDEGMEEILDLNNQDIENECCVVLEVLLPLLQDYFKLDNNSFLVDIQRNIIKKEISNLIIKT
jgi:hypothetical protein